MGIYFTKSSFIPWFQLKAYISFDLVIYHLPFFLFYGDILSDKATTIRRGHVHTKIKFTFNWHYFHLVLVVSNVENSFLRLYWIWLYNVCNVSSMCFRQATSEKAKASINLYIWYCVGYISSKSECFKRKERKRTDSEIMSLTENRRQKETENSFFDELSKSGPP